jgi:hypothetical protein
MYSRIMASSNPTVLTQYPRDQTGQPLSVGFFVSRIPAHGFLAGLFKARGKESVTSAK